MIGFETKRVAHERAAHEVSGYIVAQPHPWSALGLPRYLYSQVFFAGSNGSPEAGSWKPFLLLVALTSLLVYPCMSFPLFEPDEGRYAQIPFEMLERGDWLAPMLQGEPYLDKPPLFYWLVMLTFQVFGYHDWAARLVPAAAVQATVMLTYLFGRRPLGQRSAFWGALILSLMPAFIGMGRLLLLDGLLTTWVCLAGWCLWRAACEGTFRKGWWQLAAVCSGLGLLTKGPVALILVLPPFWLHRHLSERATSIGPRNWATFFAIALGLALPWYAAIAWTMPEFAAYFLWEHNLMRFVDPFDHIRPVWFYGPIVLAGLLPTTLLLPRAWRFLTSDAHVDDRPPMMGYSLLSAGWCLLFFSLSGCKLPTYILPAFPPLSLVFGQVIARTELCERRSVRWPLAVTFVFFLVGSYIALPRWAEHRSPLNSPVDVLALCSDRSAPVFAFPRNQDSVSFYVGRSDFRNYRSKELATFLPELDKQPRSVILFGHRHSLGLVKDRLPPHLKMTLEAKSGLCNIAVVERKP